MLLFSILLRRGVLILYTVMSIMSFRLSNDLKLSLRFKTFMYLITEVHILPILWLRPQFQSVFCSYDLLFTHSIIQPALNTSQTLRVVKGCLQCMLHSTVTDICFNFSVKLLSDISFFFYFKCFILKYRVCLTHLIPWKLAFMVTSLQKSWVMTLVCSCILDNSISLASIHIIEPENLLFVTWITLILKVSNGLLNSSLLRSIIMRFWIGRFRRCGSLHNNENSMLGGGEKLLLWCQLACRI